MTEIFLETISVIGKVILSILNFLFEVLINGILEAIINLIEKIIKITRNYTLRIILIMLVILTPISILYLICHFAC
jgi:hypothetical protein